MAMVEDILPPFFTLKRFVLSPKVSNTLIILDTYSKYEKYLITKDPEVESTFLKVYDVTDIKGTIVGHVVKHRKMLDFEFGDFYVKLGRYEIEKPKPTNTWSCEKMTFYEGENGCILFNNCSVNTFATSMIEII